MHTPSAGQPRVSVVMCTYNGACYLRKQLDTILAQDYPLYELIIQDDRSTDDTWTILEEYRAARPDLIRLYRNERNLGVNRNFQAALRRATGDLVAVADQDDVWFPNKVRRLVETIGGADLCFADHYSDLEWREPLRVRVSTPASLPQCLFFAGPVGHAAICRRDLLDRITDWSADIYYDWWIALHAYLGRGVVKVNEPLNWHRHYAGSVTTRTDRPTGLEALTPAPLRVYVWGLRYYRRLQLQDNYRRLYRFVETHADPAVHPLAYAIARLKTRRGLLSLLKLCLLTMHHYKEVYPGRPHGLSGRIHGFFCPLISAYRCSFFRIGQGGGAASTSARS